MHAVVLLAVGIKSHDTGLAQQRRCLVKLPQRLQRHPSQKAVVLGCMSQGMSNKQIARELDIAETTVKTHVSAILRKLGATSRVHAIVMAGEEDLNGYIAKRMAR